MTFHKLTCTTAVAMEIALGPSILTSSWFSWLERREEVWLCATPPEPPPGIVD